jgi:ribosome maturation factor RimP
LEVREEVRLLALPLAEEAGYEVVDVDFAVQGRQRAIRVLLDKPGGVTVGDCAVFSRRLADCLDMNQTVPWSYHLEVSSPGLERPIRTLEAVARFSGQRVLMSLHEPRDKQRNYDGELLGPDGTRVGVRTEDGNEHWFEWAEVKTTRLVVDPWAKLRQQKKTASAHGED